MKNPFHVMIIQKLDCPGRCKYCWSSDVNSLHMSLATVHDIVEWIRPFAIIGSSIDGPKDLTDYQR